MYRERLRVKAQGVDLTFHSESDVGGPQEWGGSSDSLLKELLLGGWHLGLW